MMHVTITKRIVIVGLLLFLASCVNQKKVTLIQEKTAKAYTTAFENSKSTTYRLNVGDQLYIKIYSVDPKTSKFFQTDFPTLMNPTYMYLNSYTVDEFGFINFSFVDKMYVKDLTVVACKSLIQKTLNEYFKDATVQVKLVNFQVSVLGEVTSPGYFTLNQENVTIFQAIGLAGGIKDFAHVEKVKLVRQTSSGVEVKIIDLTDNKILSSDYYYLMPNDMIYIEARNSKPFVFETFPYSILLSGISFGLAILTFLKVSN